MKHFSILLQEAKFNNKTTEFIKKSIMHFQKKHTLHTIKIGFIYSRI